MLWQGRRGSSNVDDRRGLGGGGQVAVGGGIIGVIVLVLNFLIGGNTDPSQLPQLPGSQQTSQLPPEQQREEDARAEFAKVVLQETEDYWNKAFPQFMNARYAEPRMVLFRNGVQSGCGQASAASGPFYCPADQQVYIDLSFYEELQNRFSAPGDFAMAYVIAHEVGHHVQYLMGTSEKMARLQNQVSKEEYNQYSVRLELQADFYAGLWANYANQVVREDGRKLIEAGDIEEALNAANAIGDDRLQKQATGEVRPESFTHGTSAQRMYWFKKGFQTGDMRQGDTFNATRLE
ncbi:MAG TPA: neutral zinc metallopeptidase [Chitinophagaceae bacterium]|jgi:predicted metalloprotease|nr:neutral zinc metallopeptidase [Chitinophagaceae bacterium]